LRIVLVVVQWTSSGGGEVGVLRFGSRGGNWVGVGSGRGVGTVEEGGRGSRGTDSREGSEASVGGGVRGGRSFGSGAVDEREFGTDGVGPGFLATKSRDDVFDDSEGRAMSL